MELIVHERPIPRYSIAGHEGNRILRWMTRVPSMWTGITACRLGVVYGEDSCRKLNTVKDHLLWNGEEVWDSREEALEFYMKAMAGSEGSEQERYAKIVAELAMGKAVCTDGEE